MQLTTRVVAIICLEFILLSLAHAARAETPAIEVLNDPLSNLSTSGTRGGSGSDCIYWRVPHPVTSGRVEFIVTALNRLPGGYRDTQLKM